MRRMIAAVVAALVLTGCDTTEGTGTTESPPTGTNRPTEEVASDAPEETQAPEPAPAANPKFGETYTWEDGLAVTISGAQPYTPTESAAIFEPAPAYVAFSVTVVNGSTANYERASSRPRCKAATSKLSKCSIAPAALTGAPPTPLLPGRESVFMIGYGVQNPADLVMQVSPSFEHKPIIFTT